MAEEKRKSKGLIINMPLRGASHERANLPNQEGVMNDLPRQKLRQVLDEYGKKLCDDPKRLEAFLRDLCGEYKREIFALIGALEGGVPRDLMASHGDVPREMLLERLTRGLHDRALEEDAARWAVESWALALGIISGMPRGSPILKSYSSSLKKWMRPHLRKAAIWSLAVHLLVAFIFMIYWKTWPQPRILTARLVPYSDLGPPPSIKEPQKPLQKPPRNNPPSHPVARVDVGSSEPTGRTGRVGLPVAVPDSAAPENEEWISPGNELPPGEDLAVTKTKAKKKEGEIVVLQKGEDRNENTPKPPDPEVKNTIKLEQNDQQKFVVKLSVLAGIAGASSKITYIHRTLKDGEINKPFSFRDATIDVHSNKAKVSRNGRTFTIYFSDDWRLGHIEIDLGSEASDKAKETEALEAIDFLEKALKFQSN